MNGQTVTIRKVLPATREEVFDAWLDAEGMREWMCPGPVTHSQVTLDPRVGGHFRIAMMAPGMEVINMGEIRVLNRPSKLQFTWVSSRWGNHETLVTVELHEHETRCELILTHERFPEEHSATQLQEGWGQMLAKLESYLS
jgi:uncharacterized protein YndB with AHSA1/START domain